MVALPSKWQAALDLPPDTKSRVGEMVDRAYRGFGAEPVLPSSRNDVFRAFELTALADVRAVIVGQDPYPDSNVAHGLAFSASSASPTKALEAIFSNLEASGPSIRFARPNPHDGDLSAWADRGILLLNASLTHEDGKLGEHCRVWKPLLRAVLSAVSHEPKPIPILLLGGRAVDLKTAVTRVEARVLTGHPTPRNNRARRFPLFATDRPFARANKFLTQNGALPIDWSLT